MLWTAPLFSFLALRRANVSPSAVLDSGVLAGISAAFLTLAAGWSVATLVPGILWKVGAAAGLMCAYLLLAWLVMLSEADRGALLRGGKRLMGHESTAAYHG